MQNAAHNLVDASRVLDLDRPVGPIEDRGLPHYRFGFVLNTTIGNMTRYVNLRKYAARDPEVDCRWTPVSHVPSARFQWLDRLLPRALALRLWILIQILPALRGLRRFDAVMLHLFEAEIVFVLRSYLFRRPLLVSSTDEAPVVDRATYPVYPQDRHKPQWRQAFRLGLDRWRASRICAFIPFSAWAGDTLQKACAIPQERIHPIHVGVDLELWTRDSATLDGNRARCKLLFVGADFERKGGYLLLSMFEKHFAGVAELHIVSPQAPEKLPNGTFVYRDFAPNDDRLIRLYASCDVLVLPTSADLMPWALLEAMSMELPVVSTAMGAIPEIVVDNVSGLLVPAGDLDAFVAAVGTLVTQPALRARMGAQGRRRIELEFNAALNVPRILSVMKTITVQKRRASVAL